MTRTRKVGLLIAAGTLATLALGACSHDSAGGGADAATTREPAAASAPKGAAAGALAPVARSATGSGRDAADIGKDHLTTSKIRTAQLLVAVRHRDQVAQQADKAGAIAAAAGGEVDADDRSTGRHPTATVVLKVPPAELTPVLQQLSALGAERSRSLSTRDVTSQVADVASRVTSARRAIDRLRVLYGHAVKVSNVIAIEDELSSRESDLESLEAQQRALAGETSTATITLSLQVARHASPPPPASKSHGFVGGVIAGWHAFLRGAGWLATAFGAVIPFVVLLLVLGALGRFGWRRGGHRPPVEPPA